VYINLLFRRQQPLSERERERGRAIDGGGRTHGDRLHKVDINLYSAVTADP